MNEVFTVFLIWAFGLIISIVLAFGEKMYHYKKEELTSESPITDINGTAKGRFFLEKKNLNMDFFFN